MLWRMSADLHDQRFGSMAFIGCPRPVTNVSATNVFRRPKATALTALTALTPAAAPFRAANDPHASVECTPKVRQIKPVQFLRRGIDEAIFERNGQVQPGNGETREPR